MRQPISYLQHAALASTETELLQVRIPLGRRRPVTANSNVSEVLYTRIRTDGRASRARKTASPESEAVHCMEHFTKE